MKESHIKFIIIPEDEFEYLKERIASIDKKLLPSPVKHFMLINVYSCEADPLIPILCDPPILAS